MGHWTFHRINLFYQRILSFSANNPNVKFFLPF
jgi:hypothetical protein